MRIHKFILFGAALFVFLLSSALPAQERRQRRKRFLVHEDVVSPGMAAQFEQAAKTVLRQLNKMNVPTLRHIATVTDDFRYSFIYEIRNLADLDSKPWPIVDNMWKRYDNTYERHSNFIVSYMPVFSYEPDNVGMASQEKTFRHWDYYYVKPEESDTARELAKARKALYAEKNIGTGYRVFTGGIGTEIPLFIVARWAQNAADFEAQNARTDEILGDQGKTLRQKMLAITWKHVSRNGSVRRDLSYLPGEK